jgi:hypothetical protein
MNKLLLILLSTVMAIQTPLPAAKTNDKKNKTKKNKKSKKIKKNASKKTSSNKTSPTTAPIRKEEPKKNLNLSEISKNTIEKIEQLIQKTRNEAIKQSIVLPTRALTNPLEQINAILGEKQITQIENIKNKIEKHEIINFFKDENKQGLLIDNFSTKDTENNLIKKAFNSSFKEIINEYNLLIEDYHASHNPETKEKQNISKIIKEDHSKFIEENPYYNDEVKNDSIKKELNHLAKNIENGKDLKTYLSKCIERYITKQPLQENDKLEKQLNAIVNLENKNIELITYLKSKITITEKIRDNNNLFTTTIATIINTLEKNDTIAKKLSNVINLINKINEKLTKNEIFITNIQQEKKKIKESLKELNKEKERNKQNEAKQKRETEENPKKRTTKEQLKNSIEIDAFFSRASINSANPADIKRFMELTLERITDNEDQSIISRKKHITSEEKKNILINKLEETKENLILTNINRTSTFIKTIDNIINKIQKYPIDNAIEQNKTHTEIYNIIDKIKAKTWLDFTGIAKKENKLTTKRISETLKKANSNTTDLLELLPKPQKLLQTNKKDEENFYSQTPNSEDTQSSKTTNTNDFWEELTIDPK